VALRRRTERLERALPLLIVAALAGGAAAVAQADPPVVGAVVATIPVATPRDVASGFGSIWVANGPSLSVTRIDPRTNAVLAVIPVPAPASVLAAGKGAMWVTSVQGDSVTRIDPATGDVRTVSLAAAGVVIPVGITVAYGFVWVAGHNGEPTTSIVKIDPASLAVVDVIPVGRLDFAGPQWVDAGAGSIWTDVASMRAVVRIDPMTDAIVATIPDAGACGALAASDTDVWVAGGGGPGCHGGVTRIDPATNTLTTSIDTNVGTAALALGGDAVWYGTNRNDVLGRIDAATGAIAGKLALPGRAFGLTAAFGHVWATDPADGLLFKVRPD
jgi:streptogramin lyase